MARSDTPEVVAVLRRRPENRNLFRGLGPLIVGIILFVLMVLLAPTVAPERVVEEPVETPAGQQVPAP